MEERWQKQGQWGPEVGTGWGKLFMLARLLCKPFQAGWSLVARLGLAWRSGRHPFVCSRFSQLAGLCAAW